MEQDEVFAILGSFGTEQNLAVREYLNQLEVPQLFVASGAMAFGRDTRKYPWTIGFQPTYSAEGWVYGRYVAKTMRKARIAVLFESDDDGNELLAGLERGLVGSGSRVIAAESYDVTDSDVQSQIGELKSSGANVLALFATPTFVIQAYRYAQRLGWRPLVVVNAVSAASSVMRRAAAGGRNQAVGGSISLSFLKDPADPRWKNDPGIRRYRSIMSRYAKGAKQGDVNHVYGMAVAYETVALLERLGTSPTRSGLMAAARSIRSFSNPFLLPGISVRTGKGDGFPVQQGQLQRWTKGRWVPFGGLWALR